MTDDNNTTPDENRSRTPVLMSYGGTSRATSAQDASKIELFADTERERVAFSGQVKAPIAFREATAALYAIVSSDYRYVPKDRSAYQAYQRLRRQSANLSAWESQQAYFNWLARNDPTAFLILDPVISVHPDEIFFEVFSKDEGAYAKLAFKTDAFSIEMTPVYGTTNIDFSRALFDGMQKIRSHRRTTVSIGAKEVSLQSGTAKVLEKKINVPDSWLRGFLQVQSAATLPNDIFSLAPVDLYNLMRHLRLHKDRKKERRGIRIELVPGEYPRLVLEPWETVIETSKSIFKGKRSAVIRIWGRRRLLLLRRFLPFVEKIDVYLSGSGLPSFWVFDGGNITLTLGLTGFTSSNWSRALSFDLLLPRKAEASKDLEKVLLHLKEVWLDSFASISKATGLKGAALLKALQMGCQQGALMYDIAGKVYRLRPLTGRAIDLKRLEFRNINERLAHDLIRRKGAVKIASENRVYGKGLELVGTVSVKEDRRDYRPALLIDDDGQVAKAECTCLLFRKQGLTQGPCPHMIVLRLFYAAEVEQKMERGKVAKKVTMETRVFRRRAKEKENICQITLNRERLKIRWGLSGEEKLRVSNLHFNTLDEARDAYGEHLADLERKGYFDTTAGKI